MEVLSGRLEGDHRSQWPNALSILDVLVEDLAGEAVARIGQDGVGFPRGWGTQGRRDEIQQLAGDLERRGGV